MMDRYEVRARLGHGDMGIVYEGWDREESRPVALKVYRHDDVATVARVRAIFERLRGVRHRNVVELRDLFVGPDGPVLVMERVDGEDMMAYCAGRWRSTPPTGRRSRPVRCDVARLRACVVQLVAGLVELHRAGVVHGDLKPANLRVTPEGRLVILDFSLSDTSAGPGIVGGTVAYMAPEQAMSGAHVGPGADWYALGALVYEALTGRLPFVGAPQRVLQDKAAGAPAPIDEQVADAPRDLAELCRRVLEPEPSRRATDDEMLAMVGLAGSPPPKPRAGQPPARQARAVAHVLERLREASERGAAALLALVGEPGIGRTATLAAVGEQLKSAWPDAVVLTPRALPSGAGDFLDELGEQLAAALAPQVGAEAPAFDERTLTTLLPLMPALERIRPPTEDSFTAGLDGHAAVTAAIEALREVLTMTSRRRPVALLVDDLDALDADGRRVLADSLRGPDPPPIWMVATAVVEAALPPVEALVSVPLAWWSRTEIERLVEPRALPADAVAEVVERSQGNPALALELARARERGEPWPEDASLASLFAARIARLSPSAQELLRAASLVPGGVPAAVLARVTQLDRASLDATLVALVEAGLVSSRGDARHVAPARAAVVDALAAGDDAARVRLARLVAAHGEELSAWSRARLWDAAGDRERAAADASTAARRAVKRLRYAAADDAYRLAIECGRGELHRARAEAAAAAGRGRDAAQAFDEAAGHASGAEQLRLAVRSAEQHILAGELDVGLDAYRRALALASFPLATSPSQAMPRLLARRAWLRVRGARFTPRPHRELPPFELARADACFSAGYRLGVLETVIGAELQARAFAFALGLGEPERVGLSAVLESIYLAGQGAIARSSRLVELARAEARRIGSRRLAAFAELGEAAQHFFHHNRYVDAVLVLDELASQPDLEPWTAEMAQTYGCMSICYLGDIHALTRRVLALVRQAERRGDRYAAMVYRTRTILAWLARGDADGADKALAEAERTWPFAGARYRVPDYFRLHGRVERALWDGDGARATTLLAEEVPGLERSMLPRVVHVRAELLYLQGRAAIATAPAGQATRLVGGRTRDLRRNRAGLAPALAALLDGCAALRDGDDARAVASLRDAVGQADDRRLGLHAAAARLRLGEALGGQEGAAARDRALHDLAGLGVTDVPRTLQLFAPR